MNNIHENIRKYRLEKEWTQEELAKELFVSRQLVSKWESGKSLPDIGNVERLTHILGISINDLIDDESAKTEIIRNVEERVKQRKVIGLSLLFSMVAVVIGILVYALLPDDSDESLYDALQEEAVYVTGVSDGVVTVENNPIDLVLEFDMNEDPPFLYDNREEAVYDMELKTGDSLYVRYSEVTGVVYEVQMIDSVIDKSLYGVMVTGHGNTFDDMYDAIGADQSVRYHYARENASGHTGEADFSYESGEYYFSRTYDLYVHIDPFRASEGLDIALFTSEGVEYVDTVSLITQKTYTYQGEFELSDSPLGQIQSVEVTYNIHIRFKASVDTLVIYEYDKHHELIKETVLDDWQDYHTFKAQDETLYGYIEKTVVRQHGLSTYEDVSVTELFRGEREEIGVADDDGFTRDYQFYLN